MEAYRLLNMNASIDNIELERVEHTNASWSSKDCDDLANRDFVKTVYESLLQSKEVRIIPTAATSCNDIRILPDFQSEISLPVDLDHYITTLLLTQLELAKSVCSQTQYAVILKQRLLILKRIYYALLMKYHSRDKGCNSSATYETIAVQRDQLTNDSHVLIEIGVQTGLTLMFSLLRQNWQTSTALGIPSLCNSVLRTAVDTVQKLPPLSLSNDSHLTSLGISTLDQVSEFLKEVVLQSVGVDIEGKLLAAELLLLVAVQRGSLRYLLEWIELALNASATQAESICSPIFENVLQKLYVNKLNTQDVKKISEKANAINLYDAALRLMEELVSMSVNCSNTFSNSEAATDDSSLPVPEVNEVYVWGSNSSHQLAEGGLEKINLPKKSLIFGQAQQVSDFCRVVTAS